MLGDDYTRRDRFHDGLIVDEHLAGLLPEDSMVFYNLACSYSLTDRIDESITALNKAVHLGYEDSQWMDIDPDLTNVRTDPRYKRIRREAEPERVLDLADLTDATLAEAAKTLVASV